VSPAGISAVEPATEHVQPSVHHRFSLDSSNARLIAAFMFIRERMGQTSGLNNNCLLHSVATSRIAHIFRGQSVD